MTVADAAPLLRERVEAPAHVGGIAIFDPPAPGFDYERLLQLVQERISLAPRFRQRVREVPGHLGTPVWVDDQYFDITYHVRRSALPRPGSDDQLLEFAARVLARVLDRHRPLWEMYLVEGLSGGRMAVVTKTHEAMVDEHGGIDLAQVILDAAPTPRRTVQPIWMPEPEPSRSDLLRRAALDLVRHPIGITDTARVTAWEAEQAVSRVQVVSRLARGTTRALLRSPDPSPLQVRLGQQRRLAVARTRLADYRTVRNVFGGTVNDVALAVVTGALRGWLLARDEPLTPTTTVRALVPVSVTGDGGGDMHTADDAPSLGAASGLPRPGQSEVHPVLVDLPVGESDPVLRLTQLRYAMAAHTTLARAVSAEALATLGGFAPPTLHALGARAAAGLTRRMFSLVITNVPGPQQPLYASGVRMREIFPVLPLSPGHGLSVALTSYDGGVFYGLNGDRDALRDIGSAAELIGESLAELVARAEAVTAPARTGSFDRGDRS